MSTTTIWPTDRVRAIDRDWVTRVTRPKAGDVHPAVLPTRQQQWDDASALHTRIRELAGGGRADREARAATHRAAAVGLLDRVGVSIPRCDRFDHDGAATWAEDTLGPEAFVAA